MLTCHYYYGTAVLIAVLLPGFIYGYFEYSHEKSVLSFFNILVSPVLIIPGTWWILLKVAIDLYRKKDLSNGYNPKNNNKILEMFSVLSYPYFHYCTDLQACFIWTFL